MFFQIFLLSNPALWGLMTISSGLTTSMVTADEGPIQLTTFLMESGIVSWPRSRIMLTVFILSEYLKIRILSMPIIFHPTYTAKPRRCVLAELHLRLQGQQ